jgi:hypothetical protein
VVRTTGALWKAEDTAKNLRRLGAVVLISEEPSSKDVSAYCSWHRSRLASSACIRCSQPICEVCLELSDGELYCQDCSEIELSPRRRTRLRQLFLLFLFSVFIYFVYDYLQSEREGINPNGLVRVGVLQFIPPESVGSDVLQTLNGLDRRRSKGTSLYDIAPWFNKERARFGGSSMPYLQTEILGPWATEIEAPGLDDSGDGLLSSLWGAWSYKRTFTQLADRLGVDLEDYGVRVFVVYQTGSVDLASHSRGSQKGHMAIPYVSVEEKNPAYGVVTVAHEIGHALGADDSYDLDTGLANFPGGFADPVGSTLYPQRYAELMSPDIPEAPGSEREVTSLYQVRIGHQTASQMNWIDEAEAEAFYGSSAGATLQAGEPGSRDQDSESSITGGEPSD